jgi:V/A-type H+-transporting ATPase subunit F
MKFFLISDNTDTQVGMRLSGVEGVVIHTEKEIIDTLEKVLNNPEIGIVLITEKLVKLAPDYIYDVKLKRDIPLIVEIPDRHGGGRTKGAITSYIRDAIGVKI